MEELNIIFLTAGGILLIIGVIFLIFFTSAADVSHKTLKPRRKLPPSLAACPTRKTWLSVNKEDRKSLVFPIVLIFLGIAGIITGIFLKIPTPTTHPTPKPIPKPIPKPSGNCGGVTCPPGDYCATLNGSGPQCVESTKYCMDGCNTHGECKSGKDICTPYEGFEEGTSGCVCTCDDGWTGDACDACAKGYYGSSCTICPTCNNGGTCRDGKTGNGTCDCAPGWTGATCETCNTCTACNTTCANGGTCIDGNPPTCDCAPGYGGADCSITCGTYCNKCTSSTECTQCNSPYLVDPNDGSCKTCGNIIQYCDECSSPIATECKTCQDKYVPFLDNTHGTKGQCGSCGGDLITNCDDCSGTPSAASSSATCTKCDAGYCVYDSTGECIALGTTYCINSSGNCQELGTKYCINSSGNCQELGTKYWAKPDGTCMEKADPCNSQCCSNNASETCTKDGDCDDGATCLACHTIPDDSTWCGGTASSNSCDGGGKPTEQTDACYCQQLITAGGCANVPDAKMYWTGQWYEGGDIPLQLRCNYSPDPNQAYSAHGKACGAS